jgi:methylenetetrahydrofolate dehydrogenase (NADP+)/methenyltetrahydrofolate cyclohydrolase
MTKILDGKQLSLKIREQVKQRTEDLVSKYQIQPHLVVILIGDNPASQSYVKSKEKACIKAGFKSTIIRKPDDITEEELIDIIQSLNQDSTVHGILLQLPIPRHINEDKVLNLISPLKDVDGFHNENIAKLNKGQDALVPCTPLGITKILDEYNIECEGKHCVIIGRSQIVGKPMAALMLKRNSTVTICHSRTKNIRDITKQADILIVAIGRANMVDDTYVKEESVVIDVGINRIDGKLTGDVDFEKAEKVAGYITPVPGGVGPMTIACLLENTLKCYCLIEGESK